ncbi:MAG: hypothetical protein LAP85_03125 [Acidobacteriia bacterium]|nr:hypothetical protein [Terriglobia bacterium]
MRQLFWSLAMASFVLMSSSVIMARARVGHGNEQASYDAIIRRYFSDSTNRGNQEEFFKLFATLPPSRRVELWLRDEKENPLDGGNIRDVMIIQGLDCVPCLMDICLRRRNEDRALAMHLLSEMDRFVAMKDAPLRLDFGTVRDYSRRDSKERGWNGGMVDRFMQLDGRRIGIQAKDLLYGIAEQEKDEDLRVFAREEIGLLYADLRKASLSELVERWKSLITKVSTSFVRKPLYSKDTSELRQLRRVLMESARELIPVMTNILSNDGSAAIRNSAFDFLMRADVEGIRLRRLPEGREAIRMMRQALASKRLRPENQTQDAQYYIWQSLAAQVFDDEESIADFMFRYVIGEAFRVYCGEATTIPTDPTKAVPKITPEMKRFFSYLTAVDPSYPSWEYTIDGIDGADAILHSRFKQKITRYYECWKQFKANQFVVPQEKLDPELLNLKMPIAEPTKKVGKDGTPR